MVEMNGVTFRNHGVTFRNLEMMMSEEEGGMKYLLQRESFGGNAGQWSCYPCGGANFYYDRKGKIVIFANIQDVPEKIQRRCQEGIFRVAADWEGMKKKFVQDRIMDYEAIGYRIVGVSLQENTPPAARKNLTDTVTAYNIIYAFPCEEDLPKISSI